MPYRLTTTERARLHSGEPVWRIAREHVERDAARARAAQTPAPKGDPMNAWFTRILAAWRRLLYGDPIVAPPVASPVISANPFTVPESNASSNPTRGLDLAVHSTMPSPETLERARTLTRVRNVESTSDDARARRIRDVASGVLTYYSGCRRCTVPWSDTARHVTKYGGTTVSQNTPESEQPVMVVTSRGLFVLCEPCFADLTPETRLPFYRAQWEAWKHEQDAAPAGTVSAAQRAEIDAAWPLIEAAVLAGQ